VDAAQQTNSEKSVGVARYFVDTFRGISVAAARWRCPPATPVGKPTCAAVSTLDRFAPARHRYLDCRVEREKGPMGLRFGRRTGRVAIAGLALVLSAVSLSQPRAANWFEKNFWLSGPRYDRNVPSCDYPAALDRIIANFRTKEFRFWNSELRIVGFEDIREIDFLPWAAQSIPRRYCSGTAMVNDGAKHPIYYSIAEDTGMIGQDWGVNFCVTGLDRNWAYNPACRAAKP
jgi:hypothetical protein